ncbi:hypothetical protein [Burkholderia glumae]|uniref:hypothetical protein n=1 Tax=Burkholderia glumae TaxID=337 RepID=UPI0020CE1BB4|nr:hypothetical protein [Burkholderia glumae]MCQ0034699.1 hypothetical protein [Burkholderia glumae]MCQ0040370.1 hypothetical protein [Burkholderia glumae]
MTHIILKFKCVEYWEHGFQKIACRTTQAIAGEAAQSATGSTFDTKLGEIADRATTLVDAGMRDRHNFS